MITDYEIVARHTNLDFADLLKRFTIEINEGRDQFGIRCNHCGYQFIQSWRNRHNEPIPDGAEPGEMNLVAVVAFAIEHDRPGHGTESCERYDPPTGQPLFPPEPVEPPRGRPIIGGPLAALGEQGWRISPPPYTGAKIVVMHDPNDDTTWETVKDGAAGTLYVAPEIWAAQQERTRLELGEAWFEEELDLGGGRTEVGWTGKAADYWNNAEAINHQIVQALIEQTDAETTVEPPDKVPPYELGES